MPEQTFVETEIWTVAQTDHGNIVFLKPLGRDVAIPIIIGNLEIQSILLGISQKEVQRPNSHDLILKIIQSFMSSISRVEINDLKNDTYFARLVLDTLDGDCLIDSRPSDAIGLAVRSYCPILVAESVIDEAGIALSDIKDSQENKNLNPSLDKIDLDLEILGLDKIDGPAIRYIDIYRESKIKKLRLELKKAIELEQYERASEIRDSLLSLGEEP